MPTGTDDESGDLRKTNSTSKLTFSSDHQPPHPSTTDSTDPTNGTTRPRGKSLQEKYHPVDASGKPLHAKIANATTANPHHTHLDLHHPSPVRLPSPSRISTTPKYMASKLGKTE